MKTLNFINRLIVFFGLQYTDNRYSKHLLPDVVLVSNVYKTYSKRFLQYSSTSPDNFLSHALCEYQQNWSVRKYIAIANTGNKIYYYKPKQEI